MQYTVSIPKACDSLDVRRTTMYGLIKSGEIAAIKCGRRTLVLTSSIRDFVARKQEEAR